MFRAKKRAFNICLLGDLNLIEPLEARVLLSTVLGSPSQLSPEMIEQAYNLKNIVFTTGGQTVKANGAGQTIAIVDAFGDPNIESDLRTFDANFGLSNNDAAGDFVLTVATPQGNVSSNASWDTEQALDVEWAHAIAPKASILLVQSASASVADLTDAVAWARAQSGVVAVSMSWGSIPDFADEGADDADFMTPPGHPGVTFIAASGDNGQPNYPSTSPNVLAIGGTTLTVDGSGNLLGETAWSGSGGGHSADEGTDKPDVAYDGNPSTGFLVYDSIPNNGTTGWQVVGGTSAGAPQWAAMMALVAQGRSLLSLPSLDGPTQAIPQINSLPSSDFNPVSGGGLTGLGSPNGERIISALVGGGITSVSDSITTAAAQLAFGQQPTGVTAGSKVNPSVTVLVEDGSGEVDTSNSSSVTISVANGPGTISGTLTVNASHGVATFNNLIFSAPGTYTITASDGNLISTTSGSFTITPAPASQLVFVQQPANSSVGGPISPAIVVELEDQFGNIVSTDTSNVTLTVKTGSGTLSGSSTVAAVGGVATFTGLSLSSTGTYILTASDGSLAHADSFSFTISAAAPAKVVFTQQPVSTLAGSTIAPSVSVAVEDMFGNVVSADNSNVTLGVNSGPGLLGGTITVQAVNGVAVFSDLSLNTAGAYMLLASDGALGSSHSSSFNIAPAAGSQLVFVQQPGATIAGSAIAPAVSVAVEDAFGNVVTNGSTNITLGVLSGLLGGVVTAPTINGVATFNTLSLATAGSYSLRASDGSLSGATSNTFVVSPAPASKLVFMQEPTSAGSGNVIRPVVTVAVQDQFGNLVSTDSSNVAISVASGPSAVVNGTVTQPALNGIATFGDLSLGVQGSYVLAATDGALAAVDSDAVVVSPAVPSVSDPTQLAIVQQTNTLTAGVAMPTSFVVDIEDQFGNLVNNNTSRVSLSVVGGTRRSGIHGTLSVNAVGGVATFDNVLMNVAGSYAIQARAGRLTVATSNIVTVNPGPATKLFYVQQPTNSTAGSAINPAVVVKLIDRFKNIVTNDNSRMTLSVFSGPAGSSTSGTSTARVIDGMATFDNLMLDTAGHYRLAANAGALTVLSKSITILPGAAADLSFAQQPVNVAAKHPFASHIQLSVMDAFGNAVANGSTVALAIRSGPTGAVITGKATTTVRKGIATFANVTFQTAGKYKLNAITGTLIAESNFFNVS